VNVIDRAKRALEGTADGPWRAERSKYVSGWYIVSPKNCTVVHATEWAHGHFTAPADYEFVAAARTLVPELITALEALQQVAQSRQDLIDLLKAEKRQLAYEVERLRSAGSD